MDQETCTQLEFDGSFLPFSETAEYIDVNRRCAQVWIGEIARRLPTVNRVLDVATGVGTMANLFFEAIDFYGFNPALICVDSSKWAVELARRNVVAGKRKVSFICADIKEAEIPEKVDVVTWANGIHYLSPEEHRKALENISRSLNSGGFICISSAFLTESIPEQTQTFYTSTVREAARILKGDGIERVKKERKLKYQPISYYMDLVRSVSFIHPQLRDFVVRGSLQFYRAIASFHDYAEGALPGYPIPEAARALVKGTEIAFPLHAQTGEKGERFVERRWFSITARMPKILK